MFLVQLPVLTIGAQSEGGVSRLLPTNKMSGCFRIVEFIVLVIGRIVPLFWGMVSFNDIIITDQDNETIANVAITFTKKKNVTVED